MTTPSRTQQFNRLHKILKRVYKPVLPDPARPVLEHLLFASCLENAHYAPADEAMAALVHNFFDWNEVRVSSVRELAEVMACLPEPAAAAQRVKRVLQSVFEAAYSFDLEELRKMNLGPAVEKLNAMEGTTRFSSAYVVQAALEGHAIPVDAGTLAVLRLLDLVSEENAQAGVVPGLERAVSKSKGLEFGSLLHQLGADFVANPYAPALHQLLLEICPEAAERLPKRRAKKRPEEAAPTPVEAEPASGPRPAGASGEPKAESKEAGGPKKKPVPRKKKDEEKPAEPADSSTPPPAPPPAEPAAAQETAPPAPPAQKPAGAAKRPAAKRKPTESDPPHDVGPAAPEDLPKRKPR